MSGVHGMGCSGWRSMGAPWGLVAELGFGVGGGPRWRARGAGLGRPILLLRRRTHRSPRYSPVPPGGLLSVGLPSGIWLLSPGSVAEVGWRPAGPSHLVSSGARGWAGAWLAFPWDVTRHSCASPMPSSPLFFQVTHTVEPGSRLDSGILSTGAWRAVRRSWWSWWSWVSSWARRGKSSWWYGGGAVGGVERSGAGSSRVG